MVKYVFVTGGVVSGLGKGITAASLGRLLKIRGFKVTMQKFDPYLNIDPGTMNPIQHGEVYVTDDGTETDLDLGHYERFIDENLDKNSNVTSGKIYWSVLNKEREGKYGGGTVQVIPHVTDEIKAKFYKAELDQASDGIEEGEDDNQVEIAIIEVGGTVGDIESQPFYEAIRQFMQKKGPDKACMIHVTLIPYLYGSGELKTKPTQASVRELQRMGIRADIIVCRCNQPIGQDMKDKIGLFCNLPSSHVLENLNASSIYEVPLMMEEEGLADAVMDCLKLKENSKEDREAGIKAWSDMVDKIKNPKGQVTIGLVGKYVKLHDSYLSVVEALNHSGIANNVSVKIKWVDSEQIESQGAEAMLSDVDGIIVPGGFGNRGVEGMVQAVAYAREKKKPFLGICLGMQMALIDYARNVANLAEANSTEFDKDCRNPVIDLMPEQKGVKNLGGTMRIGAYPCLLKKDSLAYDLYAKEEISERHRHRYEVNNDYRDVLENSGLVISGQSPDGHIVEMIELDREEHPYFIATQAHPEFKSRPNRAHPLFEGLIKAVVDLKS